MTASPANPIERDCQIIRACRPSADSDIAQGAHGISAKQEAFAREYARTGQSTKSYRRAFPNPKPGAWQTKAARDLRSNPKVALRIEQLRRGDVENSRGSVEPCQRRKSAVSGREFDLGGNQAVQREKAARHPLNAHGWTEPSSASAEIARVAPTVDELEGLAIIAFDDRAPDVVRLIAVRQLGALLAGYRSSTGAGRSVTITITFDELERPA